MGPRRFRTPRSLGLLAIVGGTLLLATTDATASTDYTWSGTTTDANWSDGANWGGSAPAGTVGTLSFPALTSSACTQTTPTDTCYTSTDDVSGLSANELSIDDAAGYDITGSDSLTIGNGGIDATTAATQLGDSEVDAPLTLAGTQTWTIDGGSSGAGELVLGGNVTNSGGTLMITLSNAGYLVLGGSDNLGDAWAAGADSSQTGFAAGNNGAIELNGGALTGGWGFEVNYAAFYGPGSVSGGLDSIGGEISVGDPLGTLTTGAYGLGLDPTGVLRFAISGSGTVPGTDYSQLTSTGNLAPAGAQLDITGTASDGSCPALTVGTVYTLATTTATVYGTFGGVPNGAVVALDCNSSSPPLVEIKYTSNTVTATVISTAASFVWGGAGSSPAWSLPGNWIADMAPSGSVGTLDFPSVASSYAGTDDVGGLSANTLVVDDGAGYSLTGSAPLTLRGPVGIAATGDGSSHDSPSTIAVPIALAGPQSWTIAGGYWAGLDLSGGISGPADSLHATLFDGTQLAFGGDSEVGAATFTGADSSDSGTAASSNGRITLDSGGALNASDGNPVALTDVELNGGGSLGGLTSTGSDLNVNSGVLQTNGATTLDSAGVLQLAVTADGTTPGTDFGQLSATGSIDLGGATLSLTNPGAVYPSACPSLTTGEVLTLVTTPATLSGTFTGVPDGQVVSEDCIGDEPTFTIHYTSHSVTATVVNPGPAPTTTSLSANPSSAVTGQPVTLTATVTSSSGAPAGSVLFGVGACGSAPLQQVGSSYTATCTANFAATDSPVSAQANFEPAGDTQDASVGSTTIDVAKAPTNVSFGTFVNGPADTVSVFAEYGSNTTPPVTGTVSVSVAGTPISSCQNLPVSTSQFDHGYASASCPAAGSTFGVAISYSGDANYAASSNAPAHPQTFPVTPSVPVAEAATLGISDIRARGGVVTGELSCTPRSGTACESVNVVLVARVTRQNGKVVAVAASKGRSKRHARTVQLGSATLQLNATSPTSLSLTLDSAAQKLLAARHSFTAELKVRAVGPWVATATSAPVSLSAAKPRKHHG